MYLLKRLVPVSGVVAAAHCYSDDALKRKPDAWTDSARNGERSDTEFGMDMFPRKKWDSNWDQRDPKWLIDSKVLKSASEEKQKEIIAEHKPTATRNIILIRHGQYNMDSEDKFLTDLGREQAAILGKRLANNGIKFTTLTMSTMNRAKETAEIILEKLPSDLSRKSDSLLEEGRPYPTEPARSRWLPAKEYFTQGARIEAAFRKYFHRAPPQQKEDSTEVLVCHANVIRYFVCRALQFPPEGWLRMSLGNCSMTWLTIGPNGRVALRSLGDFGHLPADKVTFS